MIRNAILAGFMIALGACAQAPVQSTQPVEKAYTVNNVVLSLAQGAARGRLTDASLRDSVVKRLDDELEADARSVGGGAQTATAKVVLTRMQLREAAARSVGGVNGVDAQVTIFDKQGNVLRGPENVSFADQARNNQSTINGIPIGLLINAGVNSADQESGKDVDRLIDGFSSSFTQWLLK